MSENCSTCFFGRMQVRKTNGVPAGAVLACLRYPPSVINVETHRSQIGNTVNVVTEPQSTFPRVDETIWCGEWRERA